MENYSESERVIRRLYEITSRYDQGFDAQIQSLLKMGLERFQLDIGILSRVENGVYTVVQCVCPQGVPLQPGDNFALGSTYCSVTCRTDHPVAIEYVKASDELGQHPAYREFQLESYIGIPIRCQGELYGTLNFSSAAPYPRQFHDIDIDSLQLMASWIEVELIRRQQEAELIALNEKLQEQARTDSLTKLPNRRSLFKHLQQAMPRVNRDGRASSIVLIDIDHFKKINDRFGHQSGDLALIAIATCLQEHLRPQDFVARYGGEEFTLWLPDTSLTETQAICRRLLTAVSSISVLNTQITTSLGICHFQCDGSFQSNLNGLLDKLISYADQSLYAAKQNGRNRMEWVNVTVSREIVETESSTAEINPMLV
ncbi:sensor domain-containing diguanylate cyclase [Photobacterium sp. TY1-4]|uniref:sensor domain-containing diguanylate cyclase n=1 Tax=Photobacterium sp. TY1-4 TaxID=2899122 RepID=UPI0021C012F4|nr:sensor domain-containing diguanylate cyclase [Photobacterium sp. TY1-4]UXI03236.1 sensor domain-containing diguanylate cyclase [Photobacterium sp. TY1-4]